MLLRRLSQQLLRLNDIVVVEEMVTGATRDRGRVGFQMVEPICSNAVRAMPSRLYTKLYRKKEKETKMTKRWNEKWIKEEEQGNKQIKKQEK